MNRVLFITIGIAVIVIVFLLWLWLFFNSSSTSTQEIFSDLGITEETELPDTPTDLGGNNNAVLNLADNTLQQLTTAPIAGFRVASSSDGRLLRYVERGTGHVYSINLESGLQTQISPNTFPSAVEAHFSPNLDQVVIVTDHNTRAVTLVTLPTASESDVTQLSLDARAENFQFLTNTSLAYTINTFTETKGYLLDTTDRTTESRFTLTLPDAVVFTTKNNTTYAHPKPSAEFAGALYEVVAGQLSPVSGFELGLLPFVDTGFSAVNRIQNNRYVGSQLPSYATLPYMMLPEKCTTNTTGTLVWCGTPTNTVAKDFLEQWYRGEVQADDLVQVYDLTTRETATLANPKNDAGRQLDVTDIESGPKDQFLFFINKIDATLWSLGLAR